MSRIFDYPPVNEQRCQNCYCSREHKALNGTPVLRCHADAPKSSTDILGRAFWPIVSPKDWCGAWSRKEENGQ